MSKKEDKRSLVNPEPVLAAMREAGYRLVRGFTRKRSGGLQVMLKPASLEGKDGNFRAAGIARAMELQCACRRLNAMPEDILVVDLELVAGSEEPRKEEPEDRPLESATKDAG